MTLTRAKLEQIPADLVDRTIVPLKSALAGRSVKVLVLEGILDVYLVPDTRQLASSTWLQDGQLVSSHRVRDSRHKRYVAPEHEEEFRLHSTSRHVLSEQFLRLGQPAETFLDGLVKTHGGAAGYHVSQILKLPDQVGVPRVLEALRHAPRYGAFSHTSVTRIVRGKNPPRLRPSSFPAEPLPQHVAEYLKAAGHSQRPLEHYERLLQDKLAGQKKKEGSAKAARSSLNSRSSLDGSTPNSASTDGSAMIGAMRTTPGLTGVLARLAEGVDRPSCALPIGDRSSCGMARTVNQMAPNIKPVSEPGGTIRAIQCSPEASAPPGASSQTTRGVRP